MTARLPHRLILSLAVGWLFCASTARAGVDSVREEARDLFDAKKYAESTRRWLEVAVLETAAADASGASWAYWRAAICETKTGDFTASSGHFALADGFLQKAQTTAPDAKQRVHALNQIALRNGWDTASFSGGRTGLGFTVHQRAAAALEEYLRRFHGRDGNLLNLSGEELTYMLDVWINEARYHEARGDLTGAIAVMSVGLEKAKGRTADPAVGQEVTRMKNNLANFFSGLGDDAAAENIYAEALAAAAEGSSRDRVRLNLARLRSQSEGPSKERLAEVRALVAKAEGAGDYTALMGVKRRLATMLSMADEEAEAAALFDELLKEARAHHDAVNEMDILLWRAKMRMGDGQFDGLEADLLRVLALYRERGLILEVFDVQRSYARLLFKQARWSEALIIYRQALALARGLEASALVPELLADIAAIYEQLGDRVQAARVWREFDAHLAAHPEFKGWRRLLAMMEKLRYLARTGPAEAARAFYAEVAEFVAKSGISEYRRKGFADFKLEAELTAAGPAPTPAPVAPAVPRAVDLQPVLARTEVAADEPGRTRFTLSNPTTATQSGTLTVKRLKVTRATRDEKKGTLALEGVFAAAGEPWHTDLTLAPQEQWLISLEAAPAATGAAEVVWGSDPPQTVKWTLGAKVGGTVYVINASETVLNPFYAVPVYHELYFNGPAPRAVPLRVVASRPCRIEIAGAGGALLAVDAEGNGSFFDRGDALYAAREGFPEIAPAASANVAAFELQVFLLDDSAGDLELAIQTRDGDVWKTQATDRIHPAKKR